jgi:hypothetical protein
MQSFECPKCGSLFRFVVRRERRPLADEASMAIDGTGAVEEKR